MRLRLLGSLLPLGLLLPLRVLIGRLSKRTHRQRQHPAPAFRIKAAVAEKKNVGLASGLVNQSLSAFNKSLTQGGRHTDYGVGHTYLTSGFRLQTTFMVLLDASA